MKPVEIMIARFARLPRGVRAGGGFWRLVLAPAPLRGSLLENHGAAPVSKIERRPRIQRGVAVRSRGGRLPTPWWKCFWSPDGENHGRAAGVDGASRLGGARRPSGRDRRGVDRVRLRFDPSAGFGGARWPCLETPSTATKDLRLTPPLCPRGSARSARAGFCVVSRTFEPCRPGWALTLEDRDPGSVRGPDGGALRLSALGRLGGLHRRGHGLDPGRGIQRFTAKLLSDFLWHSRPRGPVMTGGPNATDGASGSGSTSSFHGGRAARTSPDYERNAPPTGQAIAGLDLPKRRASPFGKQSVPRHRQNIEPLGRRRRCRFSGLDYIRPVFGSQELVDDFCVRCPAPKTRGVLTGGRPNSAWCGSGGDACWRPAPTKDGEPRYRTSDQWFWYAPTARRAWCNRSPRVADKTLWPHAVLAERLGARPDLAAMRRRHVDINGIAVVRGRRGPIPRIGPPMERLHLGRPSIWSSGTPSIGKPTRKPSILPDRRRWSSG